MTRLPADGGTPSTPSETELRNLYDEAYYRESCNHPHWFLNNRAKERARWKAVVAMLSPQRADSILDLGCAAGERTLRIARLCARAIGVDYSSAGIALARQAADAAGITNATFLQADVRDLSAIAAGSVDKAMAVDLVEHITDETVASMLRELSRIMRPGATLALYTPCRTHYVERLKARNWILRQEAGHIAVRTPDALRRLIAGEGWRLQREFYLPSSYPVFSWAERMLADVPLAAPLVRFRICMSAIRP